MEINIYWSDLALGVQEDLRDQGFTPSRRQLSEDVPIGTLTLPNSQKG